MTGHQKRQQAETELTARCRSSNLDVAIDRHTSRRRHRASNRHNRRSHLRANRCRMHRSSSWSLRLQAHLP